MTIQRINPSDFLPLSGGTMTGQVKFPNTAALPQENGTGATDFFPVGINAFTAGGRMAYKTLAGFRAWAGIDSETVTSGIFTAGSGISITSQKLVRFGKTVQLDLELKHTAAWSAGTQYNIGTLATGYRPAVNAGGTFHNSGTAAILTGGAVYVRPAVANLGELAANATFAVRATYILA